MARGHIRNSPKSGREIGTVSPPHSGHAGRTSLVPLALLVVCIGLAVASLALMMPNLDVRLSLPWGSNYSRPLLALTYLSFPLMGYLVTTRRAGNPVGPILLVAGLLVELQVFADAYSFFLPASTPGQFPPGAPVFRWFSDWLWLAWMGLMGIFTVLVFPDGHLVSSRWRLVAVIGAASIVMTATSEAIRPGPLEGTPIIENPFGIAGAEGLSELLYIGIVPWLLCMIAAAWSMRTRYLAGGQTERLQLKWFLYACVLVVVPSFVAAPLPETGQQAWVHAIQDVQILSWTALPVAAGIAVLKYRLYEIDVIINRTLVYSTLSLALGVCYVVLVAFLQTVLRPITGESSIAIAASTLAVAALFRPARATVQRFIDHRFYRRRYNAQQTLENFSSRLRDDVDLRHLTNDLASVVRDTMQPRHVSVWLREPHSVETS